MKKFKYYYSRDKLKESIGTVKANNLSEAITKAAQKKDLSWKINKKANIKNLLKIKI